MYSSDKIGGGVIVMGEITRWTGFLMVIGLAVVIGSIMIASAEDPVISIDKPSDGETVYSKMITVSGTADTMVGYIDSVTVNDISAGIDTWSADIQLEDGPNPITVVATDDMGQSRSETINVYYQAPTPPPTQPPIDHEAPSAIPTPTPTPTVSISIISIPSDAKVYLKDFFRGTTPTLVNVTVGHHKIEVIKEGYDIYSETKKIRLGDGEPEELIIELEPLTDSIYVFSTPSGASVHLDNVFKRDTNCTLSEVFVGPHTITLKKSGYFDETRNVAVPADGPLSLHVTLRRCSYIDISSDPNGADVYLDGNYTGETTPANISKVAQGNHTINLTKLGYFNEERKVDVSVAKTYPVHVNLSGYGYINISSDPNGARVYLDGEYKAVTHFIDKFDEGKYSLRLTKLGYEEVTQEIQVSAGNTTNVPVTLSPTVWERLKSGIIAIGAIGAIIAAIATSIIAYIELKKREN